MITVKGQLICGVEREGVKHRDFELRGATIADAIASVEKAGPDASHLRLRIFKAAEQMVSLGSLSRDEITGEFLLALPEDDVEPIYNAQDELEKKRKGLSNPSSPT
ncbi:MAG: hypothetical protein A3J49_03330 [Gallionellales bacterium RIFCSPHIGHO2_02_FULL_57_16]|nr:MAG: hypothetical protein A3J49_03330 [Gallionellales bacterium RIFCSPHIGHO2_02_FULL_57_16]